MSTNVPYVISDEPLGEVTTPQIEALMFPSTSQSSSSEANMSSPDAEVTIKARPGEVHECLSPHL